MPMELLAASSEDTALAIGVGAIVIGILIFLAIQIFICYVLFKVLDRVPMQFRQMSPGLTFLLLIPLFSIIWTFFVVLKVSGSLQAYFTTQGDTSVGSCGQGVGLAWAILGACTIIPLLGTFAGLAGLICMIVYLVKVSGLKNRIPLGA